MVVFFSLKVNLPSEFDDLNQLELLKAMCVGEKLHPTSSADGATMVSPTLHRNDCSRPTRVPKVNCDSFCLSPVPSINFENTSSRFVAVFCPTALVDTALEQARHSFYAFGDNERHLSQYSTVEWIDNSSRFSEALLSLIHPFLSQNFTIQAILTSNRDYQTKNKANTAVSLVVLNLAHCPYKSIIDDMLDATNCDVIHSGPEAILKILLLCNLVFHAVGDHFQENVGINVSKETAKNETIVEIPTCAVCLHRIEPSRLGLPRPRSHQLCSKFCPQFNKMSDLLCPRQRLLQPWLPPCYCEACHIIWNYWRKFDAFSSVVNVLGGGANNGNVCCTDCAMCETLWVCLTCGFVGCGRYSNKHASEHNNKTGHPFCLELSTLRIWSYVDSEYVHRLDLLECPSSLQNRPLQRAYGHVLPSAFSLSVASTDDDSSQVFSLDQLDNGHDTSIYRQNACVSSSVSPVSSSVSPNDPTLFQHGSKGNYHRIVTLSSVLVDEKTPKKATMIGEEYEVLLQSALEEQAQFYEGEISCLRATLTAQHVDRSSISVDETLEIDALGVQINSLRMDLDHAAHKLLDVQSLEAGHRATSQRLLHEQIVIQELLKTILDEASVERRKGQEEIDELELQIADLYTNQRMMEQFSQDVNLKNSQIFAAEQEVLPSPKSSKKSKKFQKFFQK